MTNEKLNFYLTGLISLTILTVVTALFNYGTWIIGALCFVQIILAAWLIACNSKPSNKSPSKSDEKISETIELYMTVFDDAFDIVNKQFSSLREDLDQAKDILHSAADKLAQSFTGLESDSDNKRQRLDELVNELVKISHGGQHQEQTEGLNKLSLQNEEIVEEFINTIKEMAENSDLVSDQITDLIEHMGAISKTIENDESTSTQLNELCKSSGQLISNTKNNIKMLKQFDISHAEKAKNQISGLWREMKTLNESASAQATAISELSEGIKLHVKDGLTSIQFEDLAVQLVDHIADRSQHLEGFVNILVAIHLERPNFNDELNHLETRKSDLVKIIDNGKEGFKKLDEKKAVAQDSMDEGEIDLF